MSTPKTKISGSQLVHQVLSTWPIGHGFTSHDAIKFVKNFHPNMRDGVITGFINHAVDKGMFKKIGYVPGPTKHRRKVTFYEMVDPDAVWNFKHPSVGSLPGRNGARGEQEELPFLEPDVEPEEMNSGPDTPYGYIAESLMGIANDIMKLQPQKLSDYTTEELIEEIKRRIK